MPDPDPTAQRRTTDRAAPSLADVVGDARARRPEDAGDPSVPVAATVVLVRDAAGGPEVLMIERPDRGSFAGAWVFPGGKLDPEDGDGEEAEVAARAAVRETWEETGLRVIRADLVPLSRWDPPPGIALRIRTWFFLAADPGGDPTFAPDEVIAGEWLRPADMLDRHGRGEATLYPPTWVTLHELAGRPRAEAIFARARLGGIRHYDTVARRGAGGPMLLWHGDAAYDDERGEEAGTARNRLDLAALPWVYTRSG